MPNIETVVAWLWPWAVGLFFSLYVGHLVTAYFLQTLREWMEFPKESFAPLHKEVPPRLTGVIEWLLFTILVGAGVEGVPTAMIGWLALKMASNWNHPVMNTEDGARAFALSALLAGVVSMLFAFLGGMTRRHFAGH
jgi:hypothetical protein